MLLGEGVGLNRGLEAGGVPNLNLSGVCDQGYFARQSGRFPQLTRQQQASLLVHRRFRSPKRERVYKLRSKLVKLRELCYDVFDPFHFGVRENQGLVPLQTRHEELRFFPVPLLQSLPHQGR